MTCSLIDSRLVCARPVEDFHQTRKDSRIQREVAGARGRAQVIHDILLPEVQPRPHSEPDNLLAQDHSVAWAARPMTEANRPESVVVMVMMTVMMVRVMCVMRVRVMVLMVGTAGSTAVVEEALRNRFKDGEGARVLGRASAGQWLYLARTAASEINMGIALVRFLLFLLIAGA